MIAPLLLAVALSASPAQHQHAGAPAPKPAVLIEGLGHLHHPIKTASPEAQKFFDQGLTLVYGFNHEEAIRAFRRAAELDPASPMPHWGIALALGPNINLDVDPEREQAAYTEAQRALALAANAPAAERAYAQALASRYSNDPKADLKKLALDYKNAMHAVVRQFPDDLDAATLYAEALMDLHPWQLWTPDGKPTEDTEEIVSVLEGVLTRDPNHIGANHYYIHAVEASSDPQRALASAKRLETLVPNAGHLVHMPSHIYIRTGNYDGAVKANDIAAAVDKRYIDANGGEGVYPLMYYTHNLDFLASAAMFTGQFGEASRAADLVVARSTPGAEQMPMIEYAVAKKMFVLLRFARWNDALAIAAPPDRLTLGTALYHFGRGVALAGLGRAADADRERAAYAAVRKTIQPEVPWGNNPRGTMLAVSDAVLDARIAWAKGDKAGSIAAWKRAVAAEDKVGYNEPPDWYYPTRESLGAALYRAGQYAEAEKTFREDLARNPNNGRSLFGLWQTILAEKKTKDAADVERQFRAAWKSADPGVQLRMEDL